MMHDFNVVLEWCARRLGEEEEECDRDKGTMLFSIRESAGDDEPSPDTVRRAREFRKDLHERFPGVVATAEAVDEWIVIRLRITALS